MKKSIVVENFFEFFLMGMNDKAIVQYRAMHVNFEKGGRIRRQVGGVKTSGAVFKNFRGKIDSKKWGQGQFYVKKITRLKNLLYIS
jgi:hypothetical protein